MTRMNSDSHKIQSEQLRYALDNVPAYVYIKDQDSRYLYANKLTLELFGCTDETLFALSDTDFFPPDTVRRLREVDLRVLQGEQTQEEIVLDKPDGSQTSYWEVKTPIYSDSEPKKIIGILGISTDTTIKKYFEEQLFRAATTDALTSLPNRRLFFERLSHAMVKSDREKSYGAVIFIDINNFKKLNDTYGHVVGDQFLAEMAQRLVKLVREYDTVARLGGDEFVVLLENLDLNEELARDNANLVADKIQSSVSCGYQMSDIIYKGSVSTGVSLFSGSHRSIETIISEADKLMYESKRKGS